MRRFLSSAIVFSVLFAFPSSGFAQRRVAFVVGNGMYDKVEPLRNAQRDAAAVSDRLRDLGFEVLEVFDGDVFTLNRSADRFVAQARGSDFALFYFAGHGIQLFDQNFLLARDVDPGRVSRTEELGLDLTKFMNALRASGTVRLAFLIDACRNNPFPIEQTLRILERLRVTGGPGAQVSSPGTASRGLARVALPADSGATAGAETLMFFAAQPGRTSADGAGLNSYYVEGLKEELAKPDRPLMEIFRSVSAYVRTVTRGEQVPQVVSDWTGDVVLGGRQAARIEYEVFSNSAAGALNASDRNLVIRGASGFSTFKGDFIARASVGDLPHHELTEEEEKRARGLGTTTGFSIVYDLDRDGREEIIRVFYRQVGFAVTIESAGVVAEVSSCLDDATAQNIEVALKDINGDRRPEVWIAFDTERSVGWGTFCILEFTGLPKLAEHRRNATGNIYAGFSVFRTLLRGNAGWHVSIAVDQTIKVCGGSGCAASWTYRYDGDRFVLADQDGQKPKGGAALPFRNEPEHAANLFADLLRTSRTVASEPWRVGRRKEVTLASTRIGNRTEIDFECFRSGDGSANESIVVRDPPPADVSVEPTLAYGENIAKAPVLFDDQTCTLESIAEGDGMIRLQFPQARASVCLDMLASAGTVTLPLLYRNSLLQFRSTGAGPAISAARRACGSERSTALYPKSETEPALAALNRRARKLR